ncbi:helix-turn-helix domain-containing protein [Siccationidurans sp. BT559]|uniref:helix-turn-helix domain-containing protein n=1 Tax=Hymenobacter sp. BT559 TaxID=2795729 RepID=UPI0018EA7EFD
MLLLAFLLITNALRVNQLANRWLGVFLACVGCVLLGRVLPGTTVAAHYPSLPGWLELTRLAMAPAFYLSVVQFTAPSRPPRWRDGLHFLPWLLFLLVMLPPLLGWWSLGAVPSSAAPASRLLVFTTPKVQAIGYWLAAYLALRRHQQHLPQLTAQPEPVNLQWLKQVLWGLALLVGLWLNELFFHLGWVLALTPVGYLGAVFYLAHYALRQPEVFAFPAPVRAELQELWQQDSPALPGPAPAAPKQARLSPSQVAYWQQRLLQLLQAEKVYLEADLSLPALAERAGLSTHELSYVLNEGFRVNFFQFINAYRVAEAQRLLASAQHQHLSMVGIAFEAGFSSKTTFNTTFKKVTGLTPSQFLQQVRAGSAPQPAPPGRAWLPPMGSVG